MVYSKIKKRYFHFITGKVYGERKQDTIVITNDDDGIESAYDVTQFNKVIFNSEQEMITMMNRLFLSSIGDYTKAAEAFPIDNHVLFQMLTECVKADAPNLYCFVYAILRWLAVHYIPNMDHDLEIREGIYFLAKNSRNYQKTLTLVSMYHDDELFTDITLWGAYQVGEDEVFAFLNKTPEWEEKQDVIRTRLKEEKISEDYLKKLRKKDLQKKKEAEERKRLEDERICAEFERKRIEELYEKMEVEQDAQKGQLLKELGSLRRISLLGITDVYYVLDYCPNWYTGELVDTKIREKMWEYKEEKLHFQAYTDLFDQMIRYIAFKHHMRKVILIAVPSSSSGNISTVNESIRSIIEKYQGLGRRFESPLYGVELIDGSDLLTRHTSIRSSHNCGLGQRPIVSEHKKTITFDNNAVDEEAYYLILDDIVTRGFSMIACYQLLNEGGVKKEKIKCLALSRTLPH